MTFSDFVWQRRTNALLRKRLDHHEQHPGYLHTKALHSPNLHTRPTAHPTYTRCWGMPQVISCDIHQLRVQLEERHARIMWHLGMSWRHLTPHKRPPNNHSKREVPASLVQQVPYLRIKSFTCAASPLIQATSTQSRRQTEPRQLTGGSSQSSPWRP